ncbi:glycosyltransferase [uncultured Oscillibacter sp.]|uniref:glycosyltransferase n=1 Tax=uncultured Oscillibacter sp. TaxID=876091 RepID=UPI0026103C50|nr:glycosyltransferase [uncultured Oscillibacter sp.]
MNPSVSIIVPVYNAEACLRRCVESVLNQEYADFELLLADDGSRDGSGRICDEYAAADSRVRVFHKENSGVSDSRNLCLDQARGRYLQFLDADDWITANATKLLVQAMEEHLCDLVISDFYRVVGERVSPKGDIDEAQVLSREEYASHMMENPANYYYGVLWNKLYRREIVERHHLRMDPAISWCEDFMFNLEYIRRAETFFALQVPVYYYVKTKGSLCTQGISISKTIQMKLTVFEYYNQFYKTVLDEEEYEKQRLKIYRFLIDAAEDGTVPPVSKRLGNERVRVSPDALEGQGFLFDTFRERKLLDYYLEPAAQKNDLSLPEARLLLYLRQSGPAARKDLADFAGLPRGGLSMLLNRLEGKGLISVTELRGAKGKRGRESRLEITFPPSASAVLEDVANIWEDFTSARFSGFSPEERELYERFAGRVQENIRGILQ